MNDISDTPSTDQVTDMFSISSGWVDLWICMNVAAVGSVCIYLYTSNRVHKVLCGTQADCILYLLYILYFRFFYFQQIRKKHFRTLLSCLLQSVASPLVPMDDIII